MPAERCVDDGRSRRRVPPELVQQAPIRRYDDGVAGSQIVKGDSFYRHSVGTQAAKVFLVTERVSHLVNRNVDSLPIARPRPELFAIVRDVRPPDQRDRVLRAGNPGKVRLDGGFAWRGCRRLRPFPQESGQDLRRTARVVARRPQDFGDVARRQVDGFRPLAAPPGFQPLEHAQRLGTVDRPLVGVGIRPPAPLGTPGRRQMNVDRPGVRMAAQPVQPAEPLRQRPHAARLGHQTFRVDVRTDLEGLRGDDDQMTLARGRRIALRRHAVRRIENSIPNPLRLAFPRSAGQKQQLRGVAPQPVFQALERFSCRAGSVCEHDACRRRRRILDQFERGFGEPLGDVAGFDAQRYRLGRVETLPHDGVRLVVVIEIHGMPLVAGRRQCHDRGSRTGVRKDGLRTGCAIRERRKQRAQMRRQMRLVQQDQTVGAGHGGVYRAQLPGRSVTPKQQPGSVHGERAQHHRRLRWIGRRARRDSSAELDHFQRLGVRVRGERTQSGGDRRHVLRLLASQSLLPRVAERTSDLFGMLAGRIDQQPPVDDPPDAGGRGAFRGFEVRLRCEPPDGDVEAGGLAQTRGNADRGPFAAAGQPVGQFRLPGKRVATAAAVSLALWIGVDGPVERGEGRHRRSRPVRRPRRLRHLRRPPISRRSGRRARDPAAGPRRSRPVPEPGERTGARRGSREDLAGRVG